MNKESKLIEVKLPKLGESISQATILNWMVKEGDYIEEGEVLLEVATDKVDSEIPAPVSGVVIKIIIPEDEIANNDEIIALIKQVDKISDKKLINTDSNATQSFGKKPAKRVDSKDDRGGKHIEIPDSGKSYTYIKNREQAGFYSPLVREIAKKHHISYEELARIPAGGEDGRLRKSDIFNYLKAGRPAQFAQPRSSSGFMVPDLKFDKGKGKLIEMDRMSRMIADHMLFSVHHSPHVTAYSEADLTQLVKWRNHKKAAFEKKYGEKLTFTPLFVEAIAKAIRDFPMINSSLDDRTIIVKEAINIGIGAALPDGNLIVPVIRNADQKDLKELSKTVNNLVEKARNNKLDAEDIQGGTFTLSNVGTFGSTMGTPIINQPQAAILATGIIKKRAEVIEYPEGDQIEIRSMMFLSLSFDHRFIGGHLAGSFLKRVADYLEGFDENRMI